MKDAAKQEQILFVDDEPNILNAFKRQLQGDFNVICAEGGQAALDMLKSHSDIAVIVSDMRMPGIDGIKVLTAYKQNAPDTIRILLTGYTDLDSAIEAINTGNIFRFLTKPCNIDLLKNTLNEAIRQYQLVTTEKTLLEKTLKGSIKILIDLLAVTNPVAFGRSQRIRKYMVTALRELDMGNRWVFEMSSLLSQIGFITIPVETIQKYMAGEMLANIEKEMIEKYPATSAELLGNIPRLEQVAKMIGGMNETGAYTTMPFFDLKYKTEAIGSILLKIISEFDLLTYQNMDAATAIDILARNPATNCPEVLRIIKETAPVISQNDKTREVAVDALSVGMILAQDVKTSNAINIASKGQEVSKTLRTIMINYYRQKRIPKFIKVQL